MILWYDAYDIIWHTTSCHSLRHRTFSQVILKKKLFMILFDTHWAAIILDKGLSLKSFWKRVHPKTSCLWDCKRILNIEFLVESNPFSLFSDKKSSDDSYIPYVIRKGISRKWKCPWKFVKKSRTTFIKKSCKQYILSCNYSCPSLKNYTYIYLILLGGNEERHQFQGINRQIKSKVIIWRER